MDTEMQILAADDVESVVYTAMREDANRTAEAKQCQLDISYMPVLMYQSYCKRGLWVVRYHLYTSKRPRYVLEMFDDLAWEFVF
jgi:hypothetical protein